jgi:hypothetical protein
MLPSFPVIVATRSDQWLSGATYSAASTLPKVCSTMLASHLMRVWLVWDRACGEQRR